MAMANVLPVALAVIAVVIGIIRPFVPKAPLSKGGSYKAFAHILVGMLLMGSLLTGSAVYLVTLVILTLLEVICFLRK